MNPNFLPKEEPSLNEGDGMPTAGGEQQKAAPTREPVELTVFSFSKGDPDFDFAPSAVDEEDEVDPKGSSAPEPVDSSSSTTPATSESVASQEKTAPAEKVSTEPASQPQENGLLTF